MTEGHPTAAEPEITLVFDGDRIAGASACNRYFAGIEEGGDLPGQVSVGPVGSTRMACEEEVMALENRYLGQLGGVSRYGFLAGRLALAWQTDDATDTMLFEPRQRDTESPAGDE
jgi:heat shock protein HslJ